MHSLPDMASVAAYVTKHRSLREVPAGAFGNDSLAGTKRSPPPSSFGLSQGTADGEEEGEEAEEEEAAYPAIRWRGCARVDGGGGEGGGGVVEEAAWRVGGGNEGGVDGGGVGGEAVAWEAARAAWTAGKRQGSVRECQQSKGGVSS